jgi:hypothetical protein
VVLPAFVVFRPGWMMEGTKRNNASQTRSLVCRRRRPPPSLLLPLLLLRCRIFCCCLLFL